MPDSTPGGPGTPRPDAPLRIGVDVGGTRIKAVAVRDRAVVARHVEPTPGDLAGRLGHVVAGVLRTVLSADGVASSPPPTGFGLVVPGLVDEARRRAVWSANLGWRDLDVPRALAGHVPLEVVLGHDVRAGLLGEHVLGAAVGVDDVLFVPLGTGLAAALMTGGRVVRGTTWTGELGHVRVDPQGPECGCGRRGCLEAVAGATAVGRAWRAAGHDGDARTVAEAVRRGHPDAVRIWAGAVEALAAGMTPVVATAGTRLVVVGGGMAEAGPTLLDPLRTALAERLPDPDGVDVVRSGLGDWSGAVGASCLAAPAPTPTTGAASPTDAVG